MNIPYTAENNPNKDKQCVCVKPMLRPQPNDYFNALVNGRVGPAASVYDYLAPYKAMGMRLI